MSKSRGGLAGGEFKKVIGFGYFFLAAAFLAGFLAAAFFLAAGTRHSPPIETREVRESWFDCFGFVDAPLFIEGGRELQQKSDEQMTRFCFSFVFTHPTMMVMGSNEHF
ncbi:MAG: hypothetical protein FJ404_11875 [Verrucomicrobia bacterium]|nr:hypothetical protein [Verrucomicrobiota bacterium]